MRTLRAKLFVSIGCILLVIALLSFILPRIFISKDISTASIYLSDMYSVYMKKVDYLSKSWITYRFIHTAAQLDAVSDSIQIEKESTWDIAKSIISQDPDIAVVQVSYRNEGTAVVSPESAKLYQPHWAVDERGRLWIGIPQKDEIYLASPLSEPGMAKGYYLLKKESEEKVDREMLTFTPFEFELGSFSLNDPAEDIYKGLRFQENLLFQKMEMIKALTPWAGKTAGILHVDSTFKEGMALLAEELFSTEPITEPFAGAKSPFVVLRPEGPFVDLIQFAAHTGKDEPTVAIGYSLSNIAADIARALQKPILLFREGKILQAFTPQGKNLPLDSLSLEGDYRIWHNTRYSSFDIPLERLTFTILIPEAEQEAVQRFLNKISNSLIAKISLNLLVVALALLALSLFFLARISKRFTKPITQLAIASEEIGKGKYEDLNLPPVENRHDDEIAILSHSFQKMVLSLRDREKIRGVLNKVVSKEIASQILKGTIVLGGEERKLTMLFSDIRGFTHLSESLTPQHVLRLLNTYMTRMCRIIDETHGVVDKFVGDEIMALYGAPIDMENHEETCLEAALLMISDLKAWNKERGEKEPQIAIGIGIHTGVAFAGNMGAENRLNYTVVGANVNLAARLCSAAAPMQILISEETFKALRHPEKFHFEKLTPILLKGIDEPVPVYAVT